MSAQASPYTLRFLAKPSLCNNDAILLVSKPGGVPEPLLSSVRKHLCNIICGPVVEHDRVIVAGNMFHGEQYSRPNKTDSTAFVTGQGKCLKIKHIVSFKDVSGYIKIFVS